MKKRFIIALLVAVVLTGCSVNEGAKIEEVKTVYFDFSPTEITDELKTNSLIDFTLIDVIDNEEKTEKIATYSSLTDVFNTDKSDINAMIHYRFNYDDTTHKVSYISFFMDRNANEAAERYLYHIYSIVSCIDPNISSDEITETIIKGFTDYDFALYEGENFKLNASRSDKYFDVNFKPIKN